MAKRAAQRSEIKAVPQFLNESLYVGIDIGKGKHLAGFLSKTLLERHERFEDRVGRTRVGPVMHRLVH